MGNQLAADGLLHVARHLVVEPCQTALHLHAHLLPKHWAVLAAHPRIARIHRYMTHLILIGIAAHHPSHTSLMQRTPVDEAHQIARRLLAHHVVLML